MLVRSYTFELPSFAQVEITFLLQLEIYIATINTVLAIPIL